ncbi:MAG TPA: hypothetical protein QGF02_02200 [Candidatus Babeliales bacterium]|nr:hypothetical protein [Candidatus Babeliales bacterium]
MNYRFTTYIALFLFLGSASIIQAGGLWDKENDPKGKEPMEEGKEPMEETGSDSGWNVWDPSQESSDAMQVDEFPIPGLPNLSPVKVHPRDALSLLMEKEQEDDPFQIYTTPGLSQLNPGIRQSSPPIEETVYTLKQEAEKVIQEDDPSLEELEYILDRLGKKDETPKKKTKKAVARRIYNKVFYSGLEEDPRFQSALKSKEGDINREALLNSPLGRRYIKRLKRLPKQQRVLRKAGKIDTSPRTPQRLPDLTHATEESGHIVSPTDFDSRVKTPTSEHSSSQVLIHPETGVWAGMYQSNKPGSPPPTAKTGFPTVLTEKQIAERHESPRNVLFVDEGDHTSLEEWVFPNGTEGKKIFVERVFDPKGIVDRTFYPVWHHTYYSPTENAAIPEIGVFTPGDLLSLAKQTIKSHVPGKGSPIKYETGDDEMSDDSTVTVDIAPALNVDVLPRGVYITFPRSTFDEQRIIWGRR